MNAVPDFARAKADGRKISMVTAYDAWSARLAARSHIDAVLVGDSVAMVVHGHASTVTATVAMMALHTAAVARAIGDKLVVSDLPFLSYRKGVASAMDAVGDLVASGAQAVKLEGVDGHEDIVTHIIGSGVPVMGHVGLTPQSVHRFGGFHVQGRGDEQAADLLRQARRLEALGCFAVVLECVPATLGRDITAQLAIPTIGIGAGPDTDGQILVLQDLWGVDAGASPKFVRRYVDGNQVLSRALDQFDEDVKAHVFPSPKESYQ